MLEFDINWWAWLVVVAFSMVVGFVWYAKGVFGRTWMALIGKTEEDLKTGQGAAMSGMVVLSAVVAFILANVVLWTGAETMLDGALAGFYVWLGFLFAPVMMSAMFEGSSKKLVWINTVFNLIIWIVGGAVFATWT